MTIGQDIKTVFQEVGSPVTILPGSTSEYIRAIINKQVTKPFIREFFMEAQLAYDTAIVAGDILSFASGDVYMVMNKTPMVLEGSVYQWGSVLYKTNVIGRVMRPASTRDERYRQAMEWSAVQTGCYALMTESLYGNELDADEELANLGLKREDLYIPASSGIQRDDRFDISEIGTVTKTSATGTITTGASIALGAAPISEDWTIVFDSATEFHVVGGDVGQVDASGTVGTALEVEGYFTIPANFFSGTWAEGDTCAFTTVAEYYWIQDVKKRRYNNVWVGFIAEDTR
jgi:hypothetical protein